MIREIHDALNRLARNERTPEEIKEDKAALRKIFPAFHPDAYVDADQEIKNCVGRLFPNISALKELNDQKAGLDKWPDKTLPFREGLTPRRLFELLKEYQDKPHILLESIVAEERVIAERARKETEERERLHREQAEARARKENEERERLRREQAEARVRETREKEILAAERQMTERIERERWEKIRQAEIKRIRQEKIAQESARAQPFSFHTIPNDVPLSQVHEFVPQLLEAYRKSEYGWVLHSELISTVQIDLHNEIQSPSMTQNVRGKLPPDILLTFGLNTYKEDMTRTFDMAGKRLSDALLTESNVNLKIKALTKFLQNSYRASVTHRLQDPSQRKQLLMAQCLENIHASLRLLTPAELDRVHELSFCTPEDPMLIRAFINLGKMFDDIDGSIDPGFTGFAFITPATRRTPGTSSRKRLSGRSGLSGSFAVTRRWRLG